MCDISWTLHSRLEIQVLDEVYITELSIKGVCYFLCDVSHCRQQLKALL